ncbi:MAG: hypothetical protein M3N24_07800 [Actinomycetota bacterium]|nr:hypothetical protein [Actinomycetota bacterium]
MVHAFDRSRLLRRAVLAGCVSTVALAVSAAAVAAPAFQTGFYDYPTSAFDDSQAEAGFGRARGAGTTVIKLNLYWATVAHARRPANPVDPADPTYDWSSFDRRVIAASRHGLQPLVTISSAPPWASGNNGSDRPNVDELALFARAAAQRYSGRFTPTGGDAYAEMLPRVRYWQVWNEPNLSMFLTPQRRNGVLVAAATYRNMVNRFTNAVKAVHPTNLVLAGGTGPFGVRDNTSPLTFMREFLCLRPDLTAKRGCGPVRFDIWGHHPYTSGGPTHRALSRNDISLGDLPKMRKVLRAAVAKRKIVSRGRVRFWIDEFSWDTRPPDPGGVPLKLHARWTAEAMYRMWKNGVTLLVWFQLMDNRWTGACGNPYQSGLYFWSSNIATAKPKPALRAFRFPFVALRQSGRVLVWGRTPGSNAARVTIQRKVGSRWRAVGSFRAGGNGVFQKRYGAPWTSGFLRAKIGRTTSVPFSLARVPDRTLYPFGQRPRPGQCD